MKKFILLFLLLISHFAFSMNKDSVELVNIQQKLISIEKRINTLHSTDHQMRSQIDDLLQDSDSLMNVSIETQKQMNIMAQQFNSSIDETQFAIKSNANLLSEEIQTKTRYGSFGFVLALLIVGIVYFILHKRISTGASAINKIKHTQELIQEESVKLDNRLIELLDKQLNVQAIQSVKSSGQEQEHSLALKVADEIVRIEMNLSRMDVSVKGHKQLCKAVERIKNNFLANGYEMVDMLGKPYNEGMKVVANFVSDENLREGEQMITGIIKPQINYNGVMIQAAQITVSQNI